MVQLYPMGITHTMGKYIEGLLENIVTDIEGQKFCFYI